MSFRIRLTAEARDQLRELIRWRAEHRPAARPLAFEIKRVLDLLAGAPHIGKIYQKTGALIRRCPLKSTPYWLFYEVDENSEVILVVAAWSIARGEGPPLY